jgi:hypothetical protein
MKISALQLRELVTYDAETGLFTWKKRSPCLFKNSQAHSSWNTKYSGNTAGSIKPGGYISIRIFTRAYAAHRLAWLYVKGKWPNEMIDHIDCSPSNNRWNNLREATPSQNGYNAGVHANNTSGFKGVYQYKDRVRWQSCIRTNSGRMWLGIFDTPECAHAAYVEATKIYHGEFGRA